MNALAAIAWNAPWFSAVAPHGRPVSQAADPRPALNTAARDAQICNARGLPIRFAPADAAAAAPYEAHIARTGEVPTRANRHDFLNALVWLAFPRAKAQLNALQARAIAASGIGGRRGSLRDAATLLDENGVLLLTRRADLVDALRRHDWHALFGRRRDAWRSDIRAVVFGHALMEKLTTPYKGVCGHALPIPLQADAPLSAIDAAVAAAVDDRLAPQRLLPLPVLGIPGWAANDDESFYADPQVFRPLREARTPAEPLRPASAA